MKDNDNHIRLSAVSAVPVVVVRIRSEKNRDDDDEKEKHVREQKMVDAVTALLDDSSPYVCLASAASLFCVGCIGERAIELLKSSVKEGLPDERWLAVQCLSEYSFCDDCIIR